MATYRAGNAWLDVNAKRLETIKRLCIEYSYKGSYGGNIPLEHIVNLFNGMTTEILRLHAVNEELVRLNKVQVEQLKEIKVDTITD